MVAAFDELLSGGGAGDAGGGGVLDQAAAAGARYANANACGSDPPLLQAQAQEGGGGGGGGGGSEWTCQYVRSRGVYLWLGGEVMEKGRWWAVIGGCDSVFGKPHHSHFSTVGFSPIAPPVTPFSRPSSACTFVNEGYVHIVAFAEECGVCGELRKKPDLSLRGAGGVQKPEETWQDGEKDGEQKGEQDDDAAYDQMEYDDDDDAGGEGGDVEVGGGADVEAAEAVVAGDEAQIPEAWLVIGRKLGKGAFGDVMEGTVTLKFGMGSRKELVACKAIQDASKEADLMRECRFHMRLNHANIVEVRGIKIVVGRGGGFRVCTAAAVWRGEV